MPARRPFRVPHVLEPALQDFTAALSEIFTNAIASAADDALERVEEKVQVGLARVQHARGVAKKRSRRGRKTSGEFKGTISTKK
jgi:hypothetical protein